ncbi:MAG: pyridoxal 5'-phosphate synthase glutaminase subunit PdxT [Dethiobacter sp.]|jgi:5'-phosphate synthase pdxT subunit|nr:pyridoxal 5'-phosphate synthase glutaminase subunit PdxT [Dethiobacter sp.]
MKIGVLCLQGAVSEHGEALASCGADVEYVKRIEQLDHVDGLIIPGGESTTIGKLIERFGLAGPIKELASSGRPVYGTCAGLILLSRNVPGHSELLLQMMDTTVSRNAYGRQRESFEADLDIPVLGSAPYKAIFIRAPQIIAHGPDVEVLATYDGHAVAARQGNILVTSFHPELTDDNRMHCYFMEMAQEKK